MKKYGFGVDVGGTTIKMGFFETDGKLLDKWEIKTNTANGGADPTKALEYVQEAIVRSRKYYSEKDGVPLLFATQMDQLGEYIIAMDKNKEIENYFYAQQLKCEQWKAKIAQAQSLLKKLSGQKIENLVALL